VWQWIAQHGTPLSAEPVAIDDASGRVLASEVVAALDVPALFLYGAPGNCKTVVAEGIGSAGTAWVPHAIGRALPGQPFGGTVHPGEAVRM
jgi:molybdopterin biosynthesis enzyme